MKTSAPFLIYDAAAGSGKTYTLVREYLTLLLQRDKNDYFNSLLALTFTNKAVNEMKERIVESLVDFSADEAIAHPPQMMLDIAEILKRDIPSIQKHSRAILKTLLHNYAAFSVETIDSFNHRLIRTFAQDLNLPSNFEVELDSNALLSEAVDSLISKIGEDEEITKILIEYAMEKADDDKSWDITKDILDTANLLTKETETPHLEKLKGKSLKDFRDFKKDIQKKKAQLESVILKKIEHTKSILETHSLNEKSFSRGSFITFINRLTQGEYGVIDYNAAWINNMGEKPMYTGTFLKSNPNEAAIIDENVPVFIELVQASKEIVIQIQFLTMVLKNLTPLSVIHLVAQEIEHIKESQNIIPILQFNALIHDEIKNQPAPFIYERLGERYKHFFIDEFQDTSQMQWQNLVPLIDNTLSQSALKKDGSLLLVGDVKQSIYRWRGGDPEQFLSLIEGETIFPTHTAEIENLPKNFRSFAEIVNFNNKFFTYAAKYFGNPSHESLYITGNEQEKVATHEGFVELSFFDEKKKEDRGAQYATKIIETVEKLCLNGFNYSDICVLTRRKSEGVLLSKALMDHGINVISNETLLLQNSPFVQCLVNTIKLTIQPDDSETKVQLLDFLHDHLNILEEKYTFFKRLLAGDMSNFTNGLSDFNIHISEKKINERSLYESIEYLVCAYNLESVADAYLYGFMDFVFEYEQKPLADKQGFLDYWEQKREKASVAMGEGTNGVKFMTIHKSKGLEFPVVIFPFAEIKLYEDRHASKWVSVPDDLSTVFDETLVPYSSKLEQMGEEGEQMYKTHRNTLELDNFNLLYVTLTRAVEQLYILTETPSNFKDHPTSYSQLFKLFLVENDLWQESKSEYSFGNFKEKQKLSKENTLEAIHPKFISSEPSTHGLHIITSPAQLWGTVAQDAINEGNLFHDTMELIKYHGDEKLIFEKMRRSATIPEERITALENAVNQVMTHKDISHLFETTTTVENERDIITKEGFVLRPDRLNISEENKSITIVDYKTGVPSYDHEDQINGYANALIEIGYKIEEKILIYTNEEIVVNKV